MKGEMTRPFRPPTITKLIRSSLDVYAHLFLDLWQYINRGISAYSAKLTLLKPHIYCPKDKIQRREVKKATSLIVVFFPLRCGLFHNTGEYVACRFFLAVLSPKDVVTYF